MDLVLIGVIGAVIVLPIAVASSVAVRELRGYTVARAILDVPNERSSHDAPVPRGGGVVIVAATLLATAAAWAGGLLSARPAVGLSGGMFALAIVGWKDDVESVPAGIRLVIQLIAAGWAVAWIGGLPALHIGGTVLPLGGFGSPLAVLGLVWLTNLYNFMDGIDGLAATTAVLVGTFACISLAIEGTIGLALSAVGLVGGSLGFLRWNWPPAKIFMGDVGSGPIGFALGTIALAAERGNGGSLVLLLVPLGPFICDATFTLLRRVKMGEALHVAHRSHVYQRLVARGWTHGQVTVLASGVTIALGGLALLSLLGTISVLMAMIGFVLLPVATGWGALSLNPHR